MSQQYIAELKAELELQHKKLALIFAIDRIRDTVSDPSLMLTNIINTLVDHLQADLCVLILLDRELGKPEMKTINDRRQKFDQIREFITPQLAEQAVRVNQATIWDCEDILRQSQTQVSIDSKNEGRNITSTKST